MNCDLEHVEIIEHCQWWSGRLFLEERHDIREPDSTYEHIHVPNIYRNLKQST